MATTNTNKILISETPSRRYAVTYFPAKGRRCYTSASGIYSDLPTVVARARVFSPDADVIELRQLDGSRVTILDCRI